MRYFKFHKDQAPEMVWWVCSNPQDGSYYMMYP